MFIITFIVYVILVSFTLIVMLREDKKKGILFLSDVVEDSILSLSLIPIVLFLIKYLTLIISKTANIVIWKKEVDQNSMYNNIFDDSNEEELIKEAKEFEVVEKENYEKIFDQDQEDEE